MASAAKQTAIQTAVLLMCFILFSKSSDATGTELRESGEK
jgi:hypothetical protein